MTSLLWYWRRGPTPVVAEACCYLFCSVVFHHAVSHSPVCGHWSDRVIRRLTLPVGAALPAVVPGDAAAFSGARSHSRRLYRPLVGGAGTMSRRLPRPPPLSAVCACRPTVGRRRPDLTSGAGRSRRSDGTRPLPLGRRRPPATNRVTVPAGTGPARRGPNTDSARPG